MVFEGVPPADQVETLQVDYLRNGGFLLFRATLTLEAGGATLVFADPNEQAVQPNTSVWRVNSQADGGFDLTASVGGAPVTVNTASSAREIRARGEFPVRLKGVCYSPAPI